MANTVTLTFAGETKQIEDSFGKVGSSAKGMSDKVGESSDGFKRAGEAADEVDTKAMGFRDTLTGVQDSAKGTSLIMKGDLFNGLLTLGMGVGDLASGFYNLIIPALGKLKIGTLASAAAQKVAAGASKVWAAAQWLMNTALFASPITWIVIGIIALVAVIVLIAKKTDWFQRAWKASWGWIKSAASNVWDWLKKVPGWIGTAFGKVVSFITLPFRTAFNLVSDAWNNTIGRLSFTFPSWIPGIGGNSISVPKLPHFHAGGIVPGVAGTPTVALLQAGERVSSVASGSGGAGGLVVGSDGSKLGDVLVEILATTIRRKHSGDPAALGLKIKAV